VILVLFSSFGPIIFRIKAGHLLKGEIEEIVDDGWIPQAHTNI
jgi:hypothetical protein